MVLKKEGLFVLAVILAVFFSLNSVDAGVLCADNQIIARLSSSTNAHGEVWNGAGNYPIEICYDRIFGTLGNGDRTCQPAGANKVIGLSGTTNAHAEDPSLSNYATNVCYGDISCTARTGSCVGNESLVLSLSANTNAHLSNGTSYTTSICCTAPTNASCTINSASWDVSQSVAGKNVDLEVTTTNCQGHAMSFLIKERDAFPGTDDNVVTNPANAIVGLNGIATSNWTAEWQSEGWPESDPPEYYFTATLISTGAQVQTQSDVVVYQVTPGQCTDGSIVTCSNYGNQQECENDICSVVEVGIPSGVNCNDPNTPCECSWNTTAGSCFSSWVGNNATGNTTGTDIGTCYYTETTGGDNCDDGFLSVNLTATWMWDPSCGSTCQTQNQGLASQCQSTTEVFQCPAQIPLPFFTVYNMIIALIIIAIIYWAISTRKKGKRSRKK